LLDALEVYDPVSTSAWSSAASWRAAREGAAATTGLDGKIYILGGLGDDGVAQSTAEVYDPSFAVRTTIAPMPDARFGLSAATGPFGQVYAIGGVGNKDKPPPPPKRHHTAPARWRSPPPLPPHAE